MIHPVFLKPLSLGLLGTSTSFLRMSLFRYSSPVYALYKKSSFFDFLLTILATPFIGFYFLLKSRFPKKPHPLVHVLFDTSDRNYFATHFQKISKHINNLDYKKAGNGPEMDYPPIRTEFLITQTIRLFFLLPFLFTYLFFLSLFSRSNLIRSYIRTAVVFLRTFHYFKHYPCQLFFTYSDNSCSAAFYAGFKKATGGILCAFQNGIRFADEGIDASCFDHFFSIGESFARMYQNTGALINKHTPIGLLTLGSNQEFLQKSENTISYDIMFIDQGWPDPKPGLWGPGGAAMGTKLFNYIKLFSKERSDLRLVYQLKQYELERKEVVEKIKKWFDDCPITVLDSIQPMQSYITALRSSLIVTMYSTMGLGALALGKPVIFFNFTGNKIYDVVSGGLQCTGPNYDQFRKHIEGVLEKKISWENLKLDYYISQNTFKSPELVATKVIQEFS